MGIFRIKKGIEYHLPNRSVKCFTFLNLDKNKDLPRDRSAEISGNAMPGIRKGIQKEETYNKYGDDEGWNRNWGYWETWGFCENAFSEVPDGESLIEGGFVSAVKMIQCQPATPKTGAYLGENRKLEGVFCVKSFQKFVETNASSPTVQLQIIMVVLAVIAY